MSAKKETIFCQFVNKLFWFVAVLAGIYMAYLLYQLLPEGARNYIQGTARLILKSG